MELTINTSSKTITIHNSVSLKELNDFLNNKFSEEELKEYKIGAEEKTTAPFRIDDPIHPFTFEAPIIPAGMYDSDEEWDTPDGKTWRMMTIGHEPFKTERVVVGVYKPIQSSSN